MATTVSSTTFAATYKDDYRDSDHFHRILFNNGKALQARELTQLQTIIQKEVARLAKFVVNEGAIFNNSGSLASGTNAAAYTYLKVAALPSGYAGLKGTEINHNNIIFATVKAIIPDNTTTETPPGTLIVRLGKSGGAATSISNVGPGLGSIIGPNGNFSSLPEISKWILTMGMILGRLELFAILVLFLPSFWRN